MSTIATGIFKKVVFKKQTGQGTQAVGGAATGQLVRRVTSSLELNKASYRSNELKATQMKADTRLGVRSVGGQINAELSVGTFQSFFESLLRQAAQAIVTTGAQTTFTAAATVAPAGTITRSAGSFITDGFKVGDIITMTGWLTTGVPNNSHNMMITALTPTVMTLYPLDGVAVAAKASGDSVTIVQGGKKIYTPQTGHTRDYYTIEHWFGDLGQSEQFVDCVVSQAMVKMPATGLSTVDFTFMGLNMINAGAQYFTSPNAAPTGNKLLTSNNGLGFIVPNVQGGGTAAKLGTITAFDMTINGAFVAPGGVVGANVDPDLFPGILDCTGNLTVYFDSTTVRDQFLNETAFQIMIALTGDNTPGAQFMAINITNVKLTDANKDDGEKGISLTCKWVAAEDTSGAAGYLPALVVLQDSSYT